MLTALGRAEAYMWALMPLGCGRGWQEPQPPNARVPPPPNQLLATLPLAGGSLALDPNRSLQHLAVMLLFVPSSSHTDLSDHQHLVHCRGCINRCGLWGTQTSLL